MPSAPPLDDVARRELVGVVGAPHVVTDPAVTASASTDWTGRFVGATPALVRPGSADEVAGVLEVCRRHAIAIVPQGGNTGLVGGSVALAGEVVLSLTRLDTVGEVDHLARQITVGAGTPLAVLQRTARDAGLRYAVDLAARDTATVGGTVATNAGGLHLVRHGGTRQQVVGVEAVLGTGDRIEWMSGLVKDNTGYHLPSLLCGSEGTLGVVTAARVRLIERCDEQVVAILAFATVAAAVEATAQLLGADPAVEAAELFLDDGLALVCEAFALPRPFERSAGAYVVVEARAATDPTDQLAAAIESLDGVQDAAVATDGPRRAELWRYREEHTAAINTLGPPHKLDVTVPHAALAPFIEDVPRVVAEIAADARTWLFGHVGDGNIHVNITGVAPDDERVDEAVFRAVAAVGGSVSAEHGIGRAKVRWLPLTRTSGEIAAMQAIKSALDPAGICNPNVLLPTR
jgi:FAD/FMN-containing dehydrogenase